MIKIGENSYSTRRPKDLDEALAAHGVSAAEMLQLASSGGSTAGQLAMALRPFLKDPPETVHELAAEIAVADLGEVRAGVVKLYGDADTEVADGE